MHVNVSRVRKPGARTFCRRREKADRTRAARRSEAADDRGGTASEVSHYAREAIIYDGVDVEMADGI